MKAYLHPVVFPKGDATKLPLPEDNSIVNISRIKSDDYIVSVKLNLNDSYILNLIEKGLAKYLYVVTSVY